MVVASSNRIARRLPVRYKDFSSDGIDNMACKKAYMRYLIVSLKMTVGLMVITGKRGAGKTLFAWMLSYYRKELFNLPCTCDHPPKRAFGDFTLFEYDTIFGEEGELNKITKMAQSGTEWEDDSDSILHRRTIWLDEAYRYCPRRRPMASMNIAVGDFIKQIRHLQSLMIMASISLDDLDVNHVENEIDVEVHARKSLYKHDTFYYEIYNRNELIEHTLEVYGPNYYPLYNTNNPIAKRMKIQKKDYSF